MRHLDRLGALETNGLEQMAESWLSEILAIEGMKVLHGDQ